MAQQRQLAWPTYLVAFTLAVVPLFDTAMQVIPFRVSDARWRFGAFGLLANGLVIPTIGFMLAFYASGMFEHRRFQRVLGGIALIFAVLVLLMLGLFALDVLQVRGEIKTTAKLAFQVASMTAAFKALLSVAALAGFGWAGLRAPKPTRATTAVTKDIRGAGMIIGNPPTAAPRGTMMPKGEAINPVIQDKPI